MSDRNWPPYQSDEDNLGLMAVFGLFGAVGVILGWLVARAIFG